MNMNRPPPNYRFDLPMALNISYAFLTSGFQKNLLVKTTLKKLYEVYDETFDYTVLLA